MFPGLYGPSRPHGGTGKLPGLDLLKPVVWAELDLDAAKAQEGGGYTSFTPRYFIYFRSWVVEDSTSQLSFPTL